MPTSHSLFIKEAGNDNASDGNPTEVYATDQEIIITNDVDGPNHFFLSFDEADWLEIKSFIDERLSINRKNSNKNGSNK